MTSAVEGAAVVPLAPNLVAGPNSNDAVISTAELLKTDAVHSGRKPLGQFADSLLGRKSKFWLLVWMRRRTNCLTDV